MTGAPREPLSGEERVLADRLARLGGSAEPPGALDARILAAAHAAVARAPAHRRRRRRWPVAFGAVATLALAVGIAWQLRPSQESSQTYSEAPAAARMVRSSGPSADELEAADATAAAPAQPAPIPPPEEPAREEQAAAADAAVARQQAVKQLRSAPPAESVAADREASREKSEAESEVAPAPIESEPQHEARHADEIVFDAPAPVDVPSPPPPPPPAPAAASAPAPPSEAAAGAAANQQRARREDAAEAKSTAAAASDDDALDKIEVTGTRIERDSAGFEDQAIDDQPPATADSPAVQRAWLQQIRELVAEGKTDAARESLREFKRRYPRYALPDDLRAFAP